MLTLKSKTEIGGRLWKAFDTKLGKMKEKTELFFIFPEENMLKTFLPVRAGKINCVSSLKPGGIFGTKGSHGAPGRFHKAFLSF